VISFVNVQLKTNFPKNCSASIIRVIPHINPDDGDRGVFEMLVFTSTLIWLFAQEDFIAFIRHESFKYYIG
jgi:hypothetical protein